MTPNFRILEVVTGYEKAVEDIAIRTRMWNECNGLFHRMRISRGSKLRADDMEGGSGEFYEAVCMNRESADNGAAEIYEILTCW